MAEGYEDRKDSRPWRTELTDRLEEFRKSRDNRRPWKTLGDILREILKTKNETKQEDE